MDDSQCCPEFHPGLWEGKTLTWDSKQFITESIPTFFHIPFFPLIGKKISKMWKLAEEAKATAENKEEILILFHDPTSFRSELYLSVTKNVPNAKNETISGTFESKVFDGSYNAVPKFMKQMDGYLQGKGEKAKKYYIHYAYCPKCAQEFGHNYMVLFAGV